MSLILPAFYLLLILSYCSSWKDGTLKYCIQDNRPLQNSNKNQRVFFQSGFEPGTKVVNQNSKTAEIIGKDNSFNKHNHWVYDLQQHPQIGRFNIQYQGGDNSQRLAEISPDPTDPNNNTLQFWIKESNVNSSKGRVQANIYNNREITGIRYSIRLYLDNNFNTVKKSPFEIKWLTIMEFWNNANWNDEDYQFRMTVSLHKRSNESDSLRLGVKSQIRDELLDKWKKPYVWEYLDSVFVVPVNKWMTLDVFFQEGDKDNGRFMLSVTPDNTKTTKIFDITNYTHHPEDPTPDGLSHFNPFKLYTSDKLIDYMTNSGKLLNVYWDDFQLSTVD